MGTVQQGPITQTVQQMLSAHASCADHLGEPVLAGVLAALDAAPRVFVLGAGRSGLVMRMFAMRLMHLGLCAFVVGETTTPALRAGDLVVACSGSGETAGTCLHAEQARRIGATLVAVTATPTTPLARDARHILVLPVPATDTDHRATAPQAEIATLPFGGSLFEQHTLLICDALCVALAQRRALSAAALWARHANLE